MNKKILIKNGRVIDPSQGIDEVRNIYIDDGYIIEPYEQWIPDEIIDAEDKIVIPGLVDGHCHLRDPGQTYKEDIESGTLAAKAGGFTTIVCMPNTNPVIDNANLIKYVNRKDAHVKVYVAGAATIGQEGFKLADYTSMKESGAIAITEDGKDIANSELFADALIKSSELGLTYISHSEDAKLAVGAINEGEIQRHLGVSGRSREAENQAIKRNLEIAVKLNVPIHLTHVSTIEAVEMIKNAKENGCKVTADTCPHYFSLTDKDVEKYGSYAKMNPPLREQKDVEAIITGLIDGTIDFITTDHAPHAEYEKNNGLEKAMNGIVGFETAFGVGFTYLVKGGYMSLSSFIRKMTIIPAKILGLDAGSLKTGSKADIVIADVNKTYTVNRDEFNSKGKNTPYDGFTLYGKIEKVLINLNKDVKEKTDGTDFNSNVAKQYVIK